VSEFQGRRGGPTAVPRTFRSPYHLHAGFFSHAVHAASHVSNALPHDVSQMRMQLALPLQGLLAMHFSSVWVHWLVQAT